MIAALIAFAPWLSLRMISTAELGRTRDLWLLATLTAGVIAVAPHALWLSLIGLWLLLHWRDHTLLGPLLSWAAVGVSWWLLRALPAWVWPHIAWVWVIAAAWQCGVVVRDWGWHRHRREYGNHRSQGALGSAAASALPLALLAPFSPWWLVPVLAFGLWRTCSLVAFAAVGAGLFVLEPASALYLPVVLGLVGPLLLFPAGRVLVDRYTPRGSSPDGLYARLTILRLIAASFRWQGHGPGTMTADLTRWQSRMNRSLGEIVTCEPAQLAHEYGVLGLLAALAFVVEVGAHLRFGDPWSAAWVAGCVLSLGHFPLRIPATGLVWLAISAKIVGS